MENGLDNHEDPNNNEDDVPLEPWVKIQQSTFTNWINDKLKLYDLEVSDLRHELKDGVILCKLMNALKGKSIGRIKEKKNMNHYESSGNLGLALLAMRNDGVKLVNIGAEDISSGNLKLILGLLWTLIRRYQIGSQSSLPPKKLMLAWVNAVLHPHKTVTNFDKDWNDGIALFGIIEYCQPGLSPDWFNKSARDKLANCAQAMTIANEQLGIPLVIDPANFSSRDLDELSGMTYMSYFMAKDAPGYKATLNWVKGQIPSTPVDNFDRDWNNGYVLTELVKSFGASVPPPEATNWLGTVQNAMEASKNHLSVQYVIPPKDMVNENVDHIGVMAYAAWHRHAGVTEPEPPPPPSHTPPPIPITPEITVTPASPETPPPTPPPTEHVPPPQPVIVPPKRSHVITAARVWRVNAAHTIAVNTKDTELGNQKVSGRAITPSGVVMRLYTAKVDDHLYHINFPPQEPGKWTVHVLSEDTIEENHLEGSPFIISVYDVSTVKIVRDTEVNTLQHQATYTFDVDCSQANLNDITVYVLYDGESMEHNISDMGNSTYRVSFQGHNRGLYTVAVYCGGNQVPGSPFELMVKDLEGVYAEGPGLTHADVGKDSSFLINFQQKIGGHVKVKILSPEKQEVDAIVRNEETGLVRVQYTPLIPGRYSVEITYDDLPIPSSPFTVDVNPGKVFIKNLNYRPQIGQKSSFILDASAAGKGTLEIDSGLPILQYDNIGPRQYEITFVPKKAGVHDLLIKYNNIIVEGTPCEVNVQDNSIEEELPAQPNGSVPSNDPETGLPINGD